MKSDRMSAALRDLGPEDRALIELYVVRKLGDGEIAQLLRVEVTHVTDRRQRAFDRLAAAAGATWPADRAELLQALRGEGVEPSEQPALAAVPDQAHAPEPTAGLGDTFAPPSGLGDAQGPEQHPASRRRRPLLSLGLMAAGLAAAVALALALVGGDDEDTSRTPPRAEDAPPSRPAAPEPTPARLRPVAGGAGQGIARLDPAGGRLRLRVGGLLDPGEDRYSIWLYDSVTDARRLASFRGRSFEGGLRLPDGYARYSFLDISREPDDGNAGHSGASVLRVALGRLGAPVR
jgi:Anti-sigma-K factor rskA